MRKVYVYYTIEFISRLDKEYRNYNDKRWMTFIEKWVKVWIGDIHRTNKYEKCQGQLH